MFEKTSRLAEKVANSVSRRRFLDSLGTWAAAAALGVAGLLTTAGSARAAQSYKCCWYRNGICNKFYYVCVPSGHSCPSRCGDLWLHDNKSGMTHCTDCAIFQGGGSCPRSRPCPW